MKLEEPTFDQMPKTLKRVEQMVEAGRSDDSLNMGTLNDIRDKFGAIGVALVIIFFMLLGNLIATCYLIGKLVNVQ